MINSLRSMAVFASVIKAGSFRSAAKELGLAPSRVSQIVSDLEKSLGVNLLYRTTRKISLTAEGAKFLEGVNGMLRSAENALDSISLESKMPHGKLNVAVPAFFAQTKMMNKFSEFSDLYPNIETEFHFSDRKHNLEADKIDVAIRIGSHPAVGGHVQIIEERNRLLVASADYAASRDKTNHPTDLEDWDWIQLKMQGDMIELFDENEQSVSVSITSNLKVDNVQALKDFAIRGKGLASLPEEAALIGINRGELVNVLPNWHLKPMQMYVVWPDDNHRKNAAGVLVDFLMVGSDGAA